MRSETLAAHKTLKQSFWPRASGSKESENINKDLPSPPLIPLGNRDVHYEIQC